MSQIHLLSEVSCLLHNYCCLKSHSVECLTKEDCTSFSWRAKIRQKGEVYLQFKQQQKKNPSENWYFALKNRDSINCLKVDFTQLHKLSQNFTLLPPPPAPGIKYHPYFEIVSLTIN